MFVNITCKPGTTRNIETGSWRMGLKPKFLHKNCKACGLCAFICPEGVIEGKEKNTFYCYYNYCKGCGICAEECPGQDIIMVEEGEKV